jgi:hypothetical protein
MKAQQSNFIAFTPLDRFSYRWPSDDQSIVQDAGKLFECLELCNEAVLVCQRNSRLELEKDYHISVMLG